MSNGDLAARIRAYVRGSATMADAEVVSSAWLSRKLDADPRTIAAALRPYGIKPAQIEPGVRGYVIADLAGLDLRSEPGPAQAAAAAAPGGGGAPADRDAAGAPSEVGPGPALDECPPASALIADQVNHWSDGMTEEQIRTVVAKSEPCLGGEQINHSQATDLPDVEIAPIPLSTLLTADEKAKIEAMLPGELDRLVVALNAGEPLPSAIDRLSAGAGHDMTPALRAAGLL